jgi:hypothetical protein
MKYNNLIKFEINFYLFKWKILIKEANYKQNYFNTLKMRPTDNSNNNTVKQFKVWT